VALDYARPALPQIEAVARLDAAGLLDEVWVPEVYGADAPTVLGYLAAKTRSVTLAAGVLPVYSRSAALIAQTAESLDQLSGGRALLGLGTSGPQVVEGLHGVPFEQPLAHLRETIIVCRQAWAREQIGTVGGPRPVPLPPGRGTGQGKPLKLMGRPTRDRIPITIAALRPGAVELAAELAEGWYPIFFAPEAASVWAGALARGAARRDPSLGDLDIIAGMATAIGNEDEIATAREAVRTELALYVGGMGSRRQNFYTETVGRLGFADAAEQIQASFLAGDRAAATAAVPDELIQAVSLVGTPDQVVRRVDALREAGVSAIVVRSPGTDPEAMVQRLAPLLSGRAAL
jgi:F420-dependent oxidoreductase-like protein